MTQSLQYIRWILFALRWVIVLALLLFYAKAFKNEFEIIFILVGMNFLYTAMLLVPVFKKGRIPFLLVDLTISAFLVAGTGGVVESPFVFYTYVTLMWIGTYVSLREKIVLCVCFFFLCFFFSFFATEQYLLPVHSHKQAGFLICFLLYVGIVILANFVFTEYVAFYRRCIITLSAIRRLPEKTSLQEINLLVEDTLKRIFEVSHVYVCWFNNPPIGNDWRQKYYSMALLERGLKHCPKSKIFTLTDYMGRKERVFFFPIRHKKKNEGAFLLSLTEKNVPWRYYYLHFNLLSIFILNQIRQLKLLHTMEKVMHEDVRKKIAQDMHDGFAQQLFFLSAQLFQIKRQMTPMMTEQLAASIEQIEKQVQNCHLEVREYITHLRDSRGGQHIYDAVAQLLEDLTGGSGVKISYVMRGQIHQENFSIEETIYRIVEEAVNNVLKHAKAENLEVVLEATSVQWTIKIKDDGVGFLSTIAKQKTGGLGIAGIKERVKRLEGIVDIHSQPRRGTEVIVIIPRGRISIYV